MAHSRQDVYARKLPVQDRGYPLWTPEPDMSLPDTYVKEGLKIGDVGVVDPEDGSFDVFFNLCLGSTHKLHEKYGEPDNCTQISPGELDISKLPHAENAGCVISSFPTMTVDLPYGDPARGHPNYNFPLSAREGAVLILHEGADRYRLKNRGLFLAQAERHAVDWYNFAKRIGRIIDPDSLYLITGFHKARSWSLAAYQQDYDAGTHEASVQFRTLLDDENDIAKKYVWRPTQGMNSRVGPSYEYYCHGIPNQTVFIVGYKIAVRESMLGILNWVKVAADSHSEQPNHAESSWSLGLRFPYSFWGGGGSTADTPRGDSPTGNNPAAGGNGHVRKDVEISHFPQVRKPFHPSDIINQYLLQKAPSANVAITHDSLWTTLVEKGLLSPEELSQEDRLIAAVKSNYPTVLERKVYLQSTLTENDIDEAMTAPKIHPLVAAFESRSIHRVLREDPPLPPDLTATLALDTKRILATGSLSVVYRCKSHLQDIRVSVKAIAFPPGLNPTEKEEFVRKVRRELGIWRRLNHPNIAPLLGTASGKCFGSDYPCIVSSLATHGALYEYIEQRSTTPSLPDRIKLIKGSAAGLEYLHSHGVVHGDLHPGNILIDDDLEPRIADFGLSQTLCPMPGQFSYLYTHSTRAGAMMWAAPELVCPELYPKLKFQVTLHGDVYSLGSTILFILSGEVPWKDRKQVEDNLKKFQNPPRPTSIPDGAWDFIERCWSPRSPESRPSAQEVLSFSIDRLEQLLWSRGDYFAERNIPPRYQHHRIGTTLVAKGLLSSEEPSQEDHLIAAVKSDYPTVLEREGAVYLQSTLTENDIDEAKFHPPVAAFESRYPYTLLQEVPPSPPDLTATLDLDTKRILATGSLSVVYRCKPCSQDIQVSVKAIAFPPGFDPTEKEEFVRKVRRELGIWRRLNHPNIALLLGTASGKCFGSDYPCIVSSLATHGALYEYIEQRSTTLSLPDRIKLIKGSAAGLEYLHSHGVVHGDLHPRNILIDDDLEPRITDFGLSQTLCPMPGQLAYLYTDSVHVGAMLWAAPELVYPKLYPELKFQVTLHGDVYSLGSIILFILSGEVPWKNIEEAQDNLKKLQNPPRPTCIPDGAWDFIERCWSPRSPESRPSAKEVLSFSIDRLEQLLRSR